MRTAEDLIARAETDGRGVAIIPLSEVGRDISLETPGAARVRLRQLQAEAAHRRAHRGAAGDHALRRGDAERRGAVALRRRRRRARRNEFVTELGKVLQGKSVTVVDGGVAPAHALAAADNAAGALTVKVLRASAARQRHRPRARARPEGPAARRSAVRLQGQRARDRGELRPAGRDPQRHRAARRSPASARPAPCSCSTSAGAAAPSASITGSTADTAQPLLASTFYLVARAEPVRRCAARRARLARRGGAPVPRRRTCRC